MSHTATHPVVGSKSEIQNAPHPNLDYTLVIEKQEEPRKERKQNKNKTIFIEKGKN